MEEFGALMADQVVENTKKLNTAFNWKELYEAKVEEVNKKEYKTAERLKSRHQMEASPKQCRQVVVGTEAEVPSLSRTSKSSSSSNESLSLLDSPGLGVGSDNVSVRRKESLIMRKAESYCSKQRVTELA